MPGVEDGKIRDGMQSLVDRLFSQDLSMCLASIKKIKHLIIGNRTKKCYFMNLGVVPRLVNLLGEPTCNIELICEAVITLGSFAHGTAENVQAVVSAPSLPLLSKGLLHPSPSVMACCLRTLRTLYSSNPSPLNPDPIFQDISVCCKLVSLLSEPHPLAQCAAVVLAEACQSCDHQNLLCAHGIIDPLTTNLLSPVAKLVEASLLCLSSVVHTNTPAAHLVAAASCKGHPFISTVLRILSGSHSNLTKMAAAKCLTYLYRCGVGVLEGGAVTLKVLPALVRLARTDVHDIALKTEAVSTLAYLTETELSLQELAADSDHLVSSLVQSLATPPDPNSDLVLDYHLQQFDQFSASVLLLLGSLASNKEEIRYRVTSEKHMMKSLAKALSSDNMQVQLAALRCLLSLSRSTKLLRTCLYDSDCWKPLLVMLASCDVQCLQMAIAVCANLLLPFSPSRQGLMEGGVVRLLVGLLNCADEVIKVNSLWALMSMADGCDEEIKQQILSTLTFNKLISFLSPTTALCLLIKAIGLLVNLTQYKSSDWSTIAEETNLLAALATLLDRFSCPAPGGAGSSGGVVEQCLCVLLNLSGCEGSIGDTLTHNQGIIAPVSNVLRSSDNVAVLMAAVDLVRNLVTTEKEGHIHRQNCLEEYGIKFALQKLEKKEHKRLHLHVIDALECFST